MEYQEVENIVKDAIITILPNVEKSEIVLDQHTKDLGADSIDRIEILLTIQKQLKTNEPMARFSSLKNIGELVDELIEVMAS